MYIILLKKIRFDQISCSGRSGTRWQYGAPNWYEIVRRLGSHGLDQQFKLKQDITQQHTVLQYW